MAITWLDPIGATLSLFATYYFTKARLRAWPLSIAAIIVNSFLYWNKGIYGQMGLEVLYFITTLYGWYYWSSHKQHNIGKAITHIPKKLVLLSVPILIFFTTLLANFLQNSLSSNIPWLDASTTLLALCAQLMLCQKWIECWILWFVVDAIVVALHWYKGIPFHSAIHFIYLGLAVSGYLKWRKLIQHSEDIHLTSKQVAY
jgi:nicotinamide mononucleotide transporter